MQSYHPNLSFCIYLYSCRVLFCNLTFPIYTVNFIYYELLYGLTNSESTITHNITQFPDFFQRKLIFPRHLTHFLSMKYIEEHHSNVGRRPRPTGHGFVGKLLTYGAIYMIHPQKMSPEERQAEITHILVRAVRQLNSRKILSKSVKNTLDVSSEMRTHVSVS